MQAWDDYSVMDKDYMDSWLCHKHKEIMTKIEQFVHKDLCKDFALCLANCYIWIENKESCALLDKMDLKKDDLYIILEDREGIQHAYEKHLYNERF